MGLKTYDPKKVSVIVGGKQITGFAETSMVTAAYDEDHYAKVAGVDGEVTRSKSNNPMGSVTLRLMQTSASNGWLQTLRRMDKESDAGVVPVLIRDAGGNDLVICREAWVRKTPDMVREKTAQEQEWVLDCADIDVNLGGN